MAWEDSLNECTNNCEAVTWNWCLLALLLSMFCRSWLLLHDLDDLLEILGCHLRLPLNCCCKCSRVFWLSQLLSSLCVLWLNLKVELLHSFKPLCNRISVHRMIWNLDELLPEILVVTIRCFVVSSFWSRFVDSLRLSSCSYSPGCHSLTRECHYSTRAQCRGEGHSPPLSSQFEEKERNE